MGLVPTPSEAERKNEYMWLKESIFDHMNLMKQDMSTEIYTWISGWTVLTFSLSHANKVTGLPFKKKKEGDGNKTYSWAVGE